MDKIKEMIKQKNFVINSLIIKNIKKFNISINEFLLLLYFININNVLDTTAIGNYTSMSETDILEAFDSLIQKKLIEVVISKKDNKIDETISLEMFYNKLVLDLPEIKKETDIYGCFESEFGRTLSAIEYETINKWLEKNISEEMIKKALKEAVLNGVFNLRYIDKILYDWTKKKISINEDMEDTEVKVFDCNWLDDDNEND